MPTDVIQSLFIYLLNGPASLNTLYAIDIGDNWCARLNGSVFRNVCCAVERC